VKGAVAGVMLVLAWTALIFIFSGFRLGRSAVGPFLAALTSGALAGGFLCGFDAASARVRSRSWAMLCRALGGASLPAAVASPFFGIASGNFTGTLHPNDVRWFAIASLAFAAGQVAAGPPWERSNEPMGFRRLLLAGFVTPIVFALGTTLGTGSSDVCLMGLPGAFGGILAATLIWVAQLCASPVAFAVAVRLDPQLLHEETEPRRRFAHELVVAAQCIEDAARDPRLATTHHQRAQEALDRAVRLCNMDARAELEKVALRRSDLYLAMGELDKADELVSEHSYGLALRAEIARRRGELDEAARLAGEWLAAFASPTTYLGRSHRANALALLALVRADQGRLDDARSLVEEARAAAAAPESVFHHLTRERVQAYIRTCSDRSRPA